MYRLEKEEARAAEQAGEAAGGAAPVNEVERYRDARYLTSSEAV